MNFDKFTLVIYMIKRVHKLTSNKTFYHLVGTFEVGALQSFHFHLKLIQLSG